MSEPKLKAKRGFACMSMEMRRHIASLGGQAQGKKVNSGNFANNRAKARIAGRKGGKARRMVKAAQ